MNSTSLVKLFSIEALAAWIVSLLTKDIDPATSLWSTSSLASTYLAPTKAFLALNAGVNVTVCPVAASSSISTKIWTLPDFSISTLLNVNAASALSVHVATGVASYSSPAIINLISSIFPYQFAAVTTYLSNLTLSETVIVHSATTTSSAHWGASALLSFVLANLILLHTNLWLAQAASQVVHWASVGKVTWILAQVFFSVALKSVDFLIQKWAQVPYSSKSAREILTANVAFHLAAISTSLKDIVNSSSSTSNFRPLTFSPSTDTSTLSRNSSISSFPDHVAGLFVNVNPLTSNGDAEALTLSLATSYNSPSS